MPDNVDVLASGQSIAESLRIECRLGGGSTSAVYGATSFATGERYAVRCWLTADAKLAARATEKFMERARETKLFDDPHVVEVFGIGELDGMSFAITEWLEGTTLERFLQRQGTLGLQQVATLFIPCMYALAAAHEAGIVHGDVRPGNVFICRAAGSMPERARLLNFECGCVSDEPHGLTSAWRRDAFRDSQPFVSPEVLEGTKLDVRSDVYAFGALLYRALSGVLPFNAADSAALAREIAAGEFVPLEQRASHLAPEVIQVIERAMSTQPEQRYASLRDMARELSDAVGELPLRAPRTSVFHDYMLEGAVRQRNRPSRTSLIAVSLCVVSLLLCVFTVVHGLRSPADRLKARSLARRTQSVHGLSPGVLVPPLQVSDQPTVLSTAVAVPGELAHAGLPTGAGFQVSASTDPARIGSSTWGAVQRSEPANEPRVQRVPRDVAGPRHMFGPDIPLVPPVVFPEPVASASAARAADAAGPAARRVSATSSQPGKRTGTRAARRGQRKSVGSVSAKQAARAAKRALAPTRMRGRHAAPSSAALRRNNESTSSVTKPSDDDTLEQMRLQ